MHGSFNVSKYLGELKLRDRGTLTRINKALKNVKVGPLALRFPAGLNSKKASVITFSDASWANAEKDSSQGG